jgi:hypothetical protein
MSITPISSHVFPKMQKLPVGQEFLASKILPEKNSNVDAASIVPAPPDNAIELGLDIARSVAIGLCAGVAAASCAPIIAGAGILGLGALAATAGIGLVAGVTAGQGINQIDRNIASAHGTQAHFKDSNTLADAITGLTLGTNVGVMGMVHPALTKIASHLGGNALVDLGLHAGTHLAVDTCIETVNQVAQSLVKGENLSEMSHHVVDGWKGTLPASLISTMVVEGIETKLKGSRPLMMALAEGLEGASRTGSVRFVQASRDQIPLSETDTSPTDASPSVTIMGVSIPGDLPSAFNKSAFSPEPLRTYGNFLPSYSAPSITRAANEEALQTLEEVKRFEEIHEIVTSRNRISVKSPHYSSLEQSIKIMNANSNNLFLAINSGNEKSSEILRQEIEKEIDKQAHIYNEYYM